MSISMETAFFVVWLIAGLFTLGLSIWDYIKGSSFMFESYNWALGVLSVFMITISIGSLVLISNTKGSVLEVIAADKLHEPPAQLYEAPESINEDQLYRLLAESLDISADNIILEKDGENHLAKTSVGEFYVEFNEDYSDIEKLFKIVN